jgi:hypothetical protein
MRRHDVHVLSDGTLSGTKVYLDGVQVGGLQGFELKSRITGKGEFEQTLVIEVLPARLQLQGVDVEAETREIERVDLDVDPARRSCGCDEARHPESANMLAGAAERDGKTCKLGWPRG